MNPDELRSALHVLAERDTGGEPDLVPGVRRLAARRRRARQGAAALVLVVVATGGVVLGARGLGGGDGNATLNPAGPPSYSAPLPTHRTATPTPAPTTSPGVSSAPATSPTSPAAGRPTGTPTGTPTGAPTTPAAGSATLPTTPSAPTTGARRPVGTVLSIALPETERTAIGDATYAAYRAARLGTPQGDYPRSAYGPPNDVYYGEVLGATPDQDVYWAVGKEDLPDKIAQQGEPFIWKRVGAGSWTFVDDTGGAPPCGHVPMSLLQAWNYPGITTSSVCPG